MKLRHRLLDSLWQVDVAAPRMAELLIESCRTITHCGRASSLVEGFNSIIRKFPQIHKRMTEGALMLVAARWTLARRENGWLSGTCPYMALTGEEVLGWLVMLGLFSTTAPRRRKSISPCSRQGSTRMRRLQTGPTRSSWRPDPHTSSLHSHSA